MEQNKTDIEKQVLMERIKEKCCVDIHFYKWGTVALAIASVVMFGAILMLGTVRDDFYLVLLPLFLSATDYLSLKYSKIIEPITDARELLRKFDKRERVSNVLGICFFICLFVLLVFLRQDYLFAGVVFGIIAVALLVIWIFGGFKNKDVERLRWLVEHEDEKSEASV